MPSVELRYSLDIEPASIIEALQAGIDPERVAGALLFMAPDIDAQKVCSHFDELFTFAGCTVSNSFCSQPASASDNLSHHADETSQTALIIYFYDYETLSSGFLSSFPKSTTKLFCFTTDEAATRASLSHLKMIGGVASTSIDGSPAMVWSNHIISHDGAVAMSIPDVSFSIETAHGWTAINNSAMQITKVNDTQLYELDGRPAIEVYKDILQENRLLTMFPLHSDEKNIFVSILSVNEDAGYLQLSQPLTEGDCVKISISSRAEILDAASNLGSTGYAANTDFPPEFVFFLSCSSREWLLCEESSAEFAKVRPFFTNEKMAMIYLDDEFAPTIRGTQHLNHSLVMFTLFGPDSDRLSDF